MDSHWFTRIRLLGSMVSMVLIESPGPSEGPGEIRGDQDVLAVGQDRLGIPFWLVGEFTTHFRANFSGWIESDVHWGTIWILSRGHLCKGRVLL